jgi:hypothetical protein
MTDTTRGTAVSQKMLPQDYILSLLLPGLSHIVHGWWRKGLVFWALLAIQGGTLYLAILRGRLAWFAYSASKSPSEYWFSTSMLFLLFFVVWAFALFDLRRSIRMRSEESYARGYWQIVARRFSKDPKGIVGLLIILFVCYVALFAPFYARGNALKMDLVNFLSPPSAEHPLGVDNFGRDILDRWPPS